MRKWFQPEIDFLTRHWNDYTAKEIGSELDDTYIIIIPKKLFPKEKLEIHKNGKYWNMFVDKSDLIAALDSYQMLKEITNEI